MKDKRGEPLLALDSGLMRINQADVFARRFDLAALETAGLEVYLERDARGRWTWQNLQNTSTKSAPRGTKESPKPFLKVANIKSTGGKVHLLDRVPPGGFRTDLTALEVTVTGLTSEKNGKAAWDVSFHSARNESVDLNGELTLEPLAVSAQLKAVGIDSESYYPYLADRLLTPLRGRLDTSATIDFNAGDGLKVSDMSLVGHDLARRFRQKRGGSTDRGLSHGRKALPEGINRPNRIG